MKLMRRIVIATGMTGGHFFPALGLAQAYRKEDPEMEIIFLVFKRYEVFPIESYLNDFKWQAIEIPSLSQLYSVHGLQFLTDYIRSCVSARRFLQSIRPLAVISFGSYGTFPAILAAHGKKIPIVIHEQNRLSGWANRVASFFAKRITTSFPDTIGIFGRKKVQYVGYPLRDPLSQISGHRYEVSDRGGHRKHWILVLGGSQGSAVINRISREFFTSLNSAEREKIAVIHITGKKQMAEFQQLYQRLGIESEVYDFCLDVAPLYKRADLALARAGAGTVFELMAYRIPAVLVPYPYAYNHQKHNAVYFASQGGGEVFEEKNLRSVDINGAIRSWLYDEKKLTHARNRLMRSEETEAGVRLVKVIQEVIQQTQPISISMNGNGTDERAAT